MTRTERRRRQQRRRRAAMQRAACLALALLAVAAAFAWSGRPQEPETPEATVPVTATALPAETPALEPITLEFEDREAIDPMEASKVALAKMVWGEARGCSTTEQAATIWCVLNRYDSGDRFWADTVEMCIRDSALIVAVFLAIPYWKGHIHTKKGGSVHA